MNKELIEKVANLIEKSKVTFNMRLTRLIDRVSTYEITYNDSDAKYEFDDQDQAYEHIGKYIRTRQAEALIKSLKLN